MISQIDDESDDEFMDSQQQKLNHYNHILSKSLNKTRFVILLTMAEPFLTASMYPIVILYIQSFSPQTTTLQISLLMFIGNIYYGLFCLIYTSLSDKYGYDKLFISSFFFVGTGIFLQAISNSIWIFIIGFFVCKVPTISVGFSYIPAILPHKYAVRYCATLWTISSIVYLLGPIIGSIIANYTNYRTVYYTNAIYHFICFLISSILIRYTNPY